jgi:hypothetical protein
LFITVWKEILMVYVFNDNNNKNITLLVSLR